MVTFSLNFMEDKEASTLAISIKKALATRDTILAIVYTAAGNIYIHTYIHIYLSIDL